MALEIVFAAGYALLLTLVGAGFQYMARQAERDAAAHSPAALRGARSDEAPRSDPSFAHLHAAHFHRGLAALVGSCALYILIIVAVRNPVAPSLAALAAAAVPPAFLLWRVAKKRENGRERKFPSPSKKGRVREG